MTIGGAFMGGGLEAVAAGTCKLELAMMTEDRTGLDVTFSITGTGYSNSVKAGTDGRAIVTVPSGATYSVSVNAVGYSNIAPQTVVAESATAKYVRFDAIKKGLDRTTFSSWAQLETLLKKGKSGDIFGLTMDFDSSSFLGDLGVNSKGTLHSFGFFTFDEISVNDGAITKLECFGSGELDVVSGFSELDVKYFQCTGLGVLSVMGVTGTGFRAFVGGKFAYFILPIGAFADQGNISNCHGWYLSI